MKIQKRSILVLCFILAGLINLSFLSSNKTFSSLPITVVELFTSEGCSSCPAADELLREMSGIREKEGKPFIALAFHITYWNRLGWLDSFSNEAYTARQKKYVESLGLQQTYTPQAIVNGIKECIGSNPIAFRNALVEEEGKIPVHSIAATATQIEDSIKIEYVLDREPKNELLNVALVEKESVRKVTRGENKSRTLKHFNVVREFKTQSLNKEGHISVKIPKNLKVGNMQIVLYAQHKRSMKIVAASQISL